MIKYIRAENTGKGFFTHEDKEVGGLSFNIYNDLVLVEGEEDAINKWVKRVNGKELTEKEYLVAKNELMKVNIEKEIAMFDTEKSDRETELAIVDDYLLKR